MGRQEITNHDHPTSLVLHSSSSSSIALLQERFKQLEKVKEMRQEKELLKLLSLSSNINYSQSQQPKKHGGATAHGLLFDSYNDYDACRVIFRPVVASCLFSRPDLTMPPRPSSTMVRLLPPHDHQTSSRPTLMNLWPAPHTTTTTATSSSSCSSDSAISLITKLDHHRCDSDDDGESDVDTSLHL